MWVLKLLRFILFITGIFRISLVYDKDEQLEYTKVVAIILTVVAISLTTVILI